MKTADEVLEKVESVRGVQQSQLLDRTNSDPKVVRSRLLTAHLLSRLWGDPDDGRVQSRLGCSRYVVKLANGLAQSDAEFRGELCAIEGKEPEAPVPVPALQEPAPQESKRTLTDPNKIAALLFRISQKEFGFNKKEMLRLPHYGKTTKASRMLAYLAKYVFSQEKKWIAETLNCSTETIEHHLKDMFYDSRYDPPFKESVARIRKKYRI